MVNLSSSSVVVSTLPQIRSLGTWVVVEQRHPGNPKIKHQSSRRWCDFPSQLQVNAVNNICSHHDPLKVYQKLMTWRFSIVMFSAQGPRQLWETRLWWGGTSITGRLSSPPTCTAQTWWSGWQPGSLTWPAIATVLPGKPIRSLDTNSWPIRSLV